MAAERFVEVVVTGARPGPRASAVISCERDRRRIDEDESQRARGRPPGTAAAVIAPQLWPTIAEVRRVDSRLGRPGERDEVRRVVAERVWPGQCPVSPWPGRSGATTR